jgi:hypothetical protein
MPQRLTTLLALLIFALGLARLFAVVGHTPVLGYANNFDMVRLQACLQVWPAGEPAGDPSFAAPLPTYQLRLEPELAWLCIPSSELVFGQLGKWVAKAWSAGAGDGQGVPLQLFGLVRATALALLAGWVQVWLMRHGRSGAALAHALLFTLILTDPANTLYFNSFYTEFSALFFSYASLLALWWVADQPPRTTAVLLWGAALLLLGLSKHQHFLLPALLLASLAITHWRTWRPWAWPLGVGAVAVTAVLLYHTLPHAYTGQVGSYSFYIRYANATDTYLGAVLPMSQSPAQTAAWLGLPPACAAASGQTWYTPGIQDAHPCPEVLEVSRARLLLVFLRDPSLPLRLSWEGVGQMRPWLLDHLGSVGGEQFVPAITLRFSLSGWLDGLPHAVLYALFALPALLFPLWWWGRWVSFAPATRTLLFALTAATYAVFFAALLGDGFIELAKHLHLYFSLWLAWAIVLLATVGEREQSL